MMPYGTSVARIALLSAYLRIGNIRRCHMALGGVTPQQRLIQLLARTKPGGKAHRANPESEESAILGIRQTVRMCDQ